MVTLIPHMAGRPKIFDQQKALASALDVFWSHGYEAASMERLLKGMGINRQSAYDTFGGKRELFLAALTAYIDRRAKETLALLTGGPTPLAVVKKFLRLLAERTSAGSTRGCLVTNAIIERAPHDPEIRRMTSDLLKRFEKAMTKTLTEAVTIGELAPHPTPRQLARLMLVTLEGALVLSKTSLAHTTVDAIASVELLLRPPN
jgi:TetR/AcrR family transcriptional repressor of nem operon